jgi:hypothetical protein
MPTEGYNGRDTSATATDNVRISQAISVHGEIIEIIELSNGWQIGLEMQRTTRNATCTIGAANLDSKSGIFVEHGNTVLQSGLPDERLPWHRLIA